MKFRPLALAFASALSVLSPSVLAEDGPHGPRAFRLSSPDLASGAFSNKFVLNGFGCAGSNVSPELRWSNVPPGTQSLALQVYDADAPTGSGFWHWAVYNIPPTATGLAQAAGTSPTTPPPGAFGGIPPTGSAALHGFVINKGLGAALLGKASFTARYGR